MKTCTTCNKERPFYEFDKMLKAPDGLAYKCKSCRKKYYEETRDIRIAQSNEYRKAHPERIKIYAKKYRDEHKEKMKEYQREYRGL